MGYGRYLMMFPVIGQFFQGVRVKPLFRCALVLAFSAGGFAQAEEERFDVQRYQVEGNTLLAPAHVEALVAPFVGHKRNYGDIQKALEALEGAYRGSGYGTVQVYVPEQELTHGVVRLQVTEGVIGKINVSGNKYFDSANIRNTLPNLREGKAPNMRQLSEDIQLANENPAKQVEVTLGIGDEEGTVDAKVNVADDNPEKFIFTLDNTGTAATGKLRAGFAYQNANVGNSDQVLTLAYTDSPDKPTSIKVEIFSLAYRIPFYSVGDSVDIIYGKSSVNTPIVQQTGFNLAGKGDVLGLRWNHYFPRRGEYTSKLVTGLDYKLIDTRCTTAGQPSDINPPNGGGSACTPYTLRPLSVTYSGQRASPGQLLDYSIGALSNLSLGSSYNYTALDGRTGNDRYTMINGGRMVPNNFMAYKTTVSFLRALPLDWAMRVGLNAQYSSTALPAAEQIGLAGSTAVRGFNERAVAMDKGFVVNLEVYSPELAGHVGLPGSLKAVGFYDFASGYNYSTVRPQPWTTPVQNAGIASIGAGLRYSLAKDISLRADLARVVDAGPVDIEPGTISTVPSNTEGRGDWRGHFGLQVSF